MDSGNSESMQSSSGGSEEYDSRADSISAFMIANNHPSPHVGGHRGPLALGGQPPHHSPISSSSSSAMFDPLLGNYLDHHSLSRSPANPDAVWSKNIRSEPPNCTDLGGFMPSSSPSPSPTHPFLTNQQAAAAAAQSRATFPPMQQQQMMMMMGQGQGQGQGPDSSGTKSSASVSGTSDPHHHQPNNNNNNNNNNRNSNSNNNMNIVVQQRNPKKRSRASRRAPTTVLTTDTTNFRAMVQEFTGIPAPPFTSSPFPRTRLDLFGPPSTMSMSMSMSIRSPLDLSHSPPHYLLRPFPQKIQPPPFLNSPSSDAAIPSTTNNTATTTTTSSASTSINYQLPSELGLLKQQQQQQQQPPQNLLNINMQNPILNFQSLLQTTPSNSKYPIPNSSSSPSILGAKALDHDIPSNDSPLKMGGMLDHEFGLSHAHHHHHVNTNLPNPNIMVSSSDDNASGNRARWGQGTGSQHHDRQHDDQALLSSINGSSYNTNSYHTVSNGKVMTTNFSPSSSDFHGDKGSENVATRSEGMVEQWICSSD